MVPSQLPDVILLDVKMPGLSGDKAASILKDSRFWQDVLVLLHSDLKDGELAALVAETGAAGYIRKSENNGELVAQLRHRIEEAGRG